MKNYIFLFLVLFLTPFISKGQDFIYTPVNPAFGGYYANHSWLMASAQAQNKHKDDSSDPFNDPFNKKENSLDNLQSSIQSQLVNRLTQQILDQQFGDLKLETGQYKVGDFIININEGTSNLNIEIFDSANGGRTDITLPSGN